MDNIFFRLCAERRRLSLTQEEFATAGGVSKRTYCNYESGSRTCDADFLVGVAKIGADVQYIVTGVRSANLSALTSIYTSSFLASREAAKLPDRVVALLESYEQCSIPMKDAIDRTVRALANRSKVEMALGVMQIGESLFKAE